MKTMKNKGFTKIELIAVIAIVAILAATIIPTFLSLAESSAAQEEMQAELDKLSQQLDQQNSISIEEIEAKIAAQIAGIKLPEGVKSEDVNKAISDALAGIKIPEGGITDAEVQTIIANAVANLKLPESGLSAADVEKIVNEAIAGIKIPEAGLTADEIKAIVSDALKGVNTQSGVSSADVQKIVDDAIKNLKLPETGISAADAEKIIAEALANVKLPEAGLSAADVEKIISDALAGFEVPSAPSTADIEKIVADALANITIPEAGVSAADVEKMINDAIVAALATVQPGVSDADLKVAIEAAVKGILAQLGDTYLTEAEIQALINKALESVKPEDTTAPAASKATTLQLSSTYLAINVGTSGSIYATVLDQYGKVMPSAKLIWTTNNNNCAYVSGGVVYGLASGTAVVNVSVEGTTLTGSCLVYVAGSTTPSQPVNVAVTGVTLNYASAELLVGQSTTLISTVYPTNATNKTVAWLSSNTAVATVDGGKVTAVGAGTATITVITTDGAKMANCTVTVTAPAPAPSTAEVSTAAAFANAVNDPTIGTIVLSANVKLDETVNITRDVVLDLNGNKLTTLSTSVYPNACTLAVAKDCDVTIKNGTVVTNSTKLNGGMDFIRVSTNANLVLDNVVVAISVTPEVMWNNTMDRWQMNTAEHHIFTIASGATVTLNNSVIDVVAPVVNNFSTYTRNMTVVGVYFVTNSNNAQFVMNGGSFTMKTTEPKATKITDTLHFMKADKIDSDATNTVEINGTAKIAIGAPNKAGTLNSTNYLYIAQLHWVSPNNYYSGVETVKIDAGVSFSINGKTYTLNATKSYVTENADKTLLGLIKGDCTVVEEKYHFVCSDRPFGCAYEVDLTLAELADFISKYTTITIDGMVYADCPYCKYGGLYIAEGTVPSLPATVPAESVALSQTTATLTVGDSVSLIATVLPANASNKSVSWTSSNTAVATVVNGKVTAVGAGTATITVTTKDGGFTASCVVTVKAAPVAVTGVTLDKTTANPTVGETTTLTVTVYPANASNKSIIWTSSNPAVATVDANGKVTTVGVGTATITATTVDGGFTATFFVTVKGAPTPIVEVNNVTDFASAIANPDVTEIVLKANLNLTEAYTVSKDITINLNGYVLTPAKEIVYPNAGIITVAQGAEVVIKGGVINESTKNLDGGQTFIRVSAGANLVLDNVVINITVNPKVFFNNTMDRWQMNSAEHRVITISSDASVTLNNTNISVIAPDVVNFKTYTRNMTIVGVYFAQNSNNAKFVMNGGSFTIKTTEPNATKSTDTIYFIKSDRADVEATNTVEINGNAKITLGDVNASGALTSTNYLYVSQKRWVSPNYVYGGLDTVKISTGASISLSGATYTLNTASAVTFVTKASEINLLSLMMEKCNVVETKYHFACACGFTADLTVKEIANHVQKYTTVTVDGIAYPKCPNCKNGYISLIP